MGYELYITRQKSWYEPEEINAISLEDWAHYVQSDPEMRMDGYAEVSPEPGTNLRIEKDGLAVWTAYSAAGIDQNQAWFSYSKGNISVKNPDPEIIGKMIKIARALNAKVQGDEGELYEEENIQGRLENHPAKTKRPWWKIWK